MSLYRCAACGSPHVAPDTQAGEIGFNYLKGTAGTLVLGAGGAVAGIESKTEQVFKCPDCGLTLTYPMEPFMKAMIDLGVESLEARNHLTFGNGVNISWDWLTKQYKNIEKGPADTEMANRTAMEKAKMLAMATATKEEFDAAVDVIGDINRRMRLNGSIYDLREEDHFSFDNPMTLDEYLSWKSAVKIIVENISKYLPPPLVDGTKYRGVLDELLLPSLLWSYLNDGTFPYRKEDFESRLKWEIENGVGSEIVKSVSLSYNCKVYSKRYDPWFKKWFNDAEAPGSVDFYSLKAMLLRTVYIKGDFQGIKEFVFETYEFPRVIIRNGLLGFGIHSFSRWESNGLEDSDPYFDINELIDDYFSQFPEKRESFSAKIAEYKMQKTSYAQKETDNKTRLKEVSDLKAKIEENTKLIEILEKKVFGKAKAREEISALKKDNQQKAAAIDQISEEIAAFNDIKKPEKEEDFVNDLILEYQGFIAWRWAYKQDDPIKMPEINVEEKKEAEKKVEPIETDSQSDIPSIIKKYVELLNMGAITQEEYDAKKKQLLGL